ncbi:hypothetical protein FRX31_007720 [Thalictrum thalictroides]|uniref:RNase H type-1 domain-containing protein n=1 Tax=Thalictrum thalictroides TaxID=46969 RepID=A0A7J6X038_THATH|nr:hypothetical protein FRX31_007720 [Thalictrum thalictroides]
MGEKKGLKNLIVETDFKGAVDYLEGKPTNLSWIATNLLEQVALFFFLDFDNIKVIFCNRNGNMAAYLLAKNSAVSNFGPVSFLYPPVWLLPQLQKDLLFCNS